MKITDIANEIFLINGSPTTTSIPAIAFWVRHQIGRLSTLLYENFQFNPNTLEICHEDWKQGTCYHCEPWNMNCPPNSPPTPVYEGLGFPVVAIINQMYRVYDLEVQIRTQMNFINNQSDIISVEDQHTVIMKINRNSLSQTLNNIRKDEIKMLDELVMHYRLNKNRPADVSGDDTVPGFYDAYWSAYPAYIRR